MLRHELNLIGLIRLTAFVSAVAFACLAAYTGVSEQHFIDQAERTVGVVSEVSDGFITVSFPIRNAGTVLKRFDVKDVVLGSMVQLLYVLRGSDTIVQLDRPSELWAPMWGWIEWCVVALLVAVYGRALVEDPLSVIGFRGARLWRRR